MVAVVQGYKVISRQEREGKGEPPMCRLLCSTVGQKYVGSGHNLNNSVTWNFLN